MTTPIIIAGCIVIPLALPGITLIYSKRAQKSKTWKEEREKIKDYEEQIKEETRNKYK